MLNLNINSERFGSCQYCGTSCERVCSACKAWYCSDQCIAMDWNMHKNYCRPQTLHIDQYEKRTQNSNYFQRKGISHSSFTTKKDDARVQASKDFSRHPHIPSDKYTKGKRSFNTQNMAATKYDPSPDQIDPKISFNHQQEQNISNNSRLPRTINERETISTNVETPFIPTDRFTKDGDTCEVQIQGFPIKNEAFSMPPPTVASEGLFNTQDMATSNGTSADKSDLKNSLNNQQQQHINDNSRLSLTINEREKTLTKVETPFIPTDRFTKIVVSWIDEPIYWVFRYDDVETQSKIENTLNMHCTSIHAKRISPHDNKCCASFEGAWYRAKILSKDGDTVVVRFVDFGNDASIKLSEAINVPEELRLVKPLAFKVKFPGEKPNTLTLDTVLDVKAIKQDGDTCEVQVQGFPIKNEAYSMPPPTVAVTSKVHEPRLPTNEVSKVNDSSNKLHAANTNRILTKSSEENINELINLKFTIINDNYTESDNSDEINKQSRNQEDMSNKNLMTKTTCNTDDHKVQVSVKAQNISPIPTDRFSKIVVSWIDEPTYWVFRFDDAEIQTELELKLNVYCTSTRAKLISQNENNCCAFFDGGWYRAHILSKDNDTALVKFIDFGNDASIKLSEALKVPEELLLVEPLAFQVRFPHGKPNKITLNSTFDVKAIKMDGDVCEAQIEGYPMNREVSVMNLSPPAVSVSDNIVLPQANGVGNPDILKNTAPPRIPVLHYSQKRRNNHMLYQIEPSWSNISVQAHTFIGENCITGFIFVDDTLQIKNIEKELSLTNADPEFKPSLKDEVCARIGGIWYRGIVTLINPVKTNVALVDVGAIVVPDALAPLPQHLKSIADRAVRCIFSTSQKTNLVGEQFVLHNLQKEAVMLTGDTDKFGQVAIIPWDPMCEDAGLITENIQSGILYKLTAFHSPNEIYLQSQEQNQTLRLNNLIRDVTTFSLGAPLLIRKPWCGQLVSCLSHKNNRYTRAQVIKQIGDRYEVKYIDTGLVETVPFSNIKALSDNFKSVPCFATKVGLKGIPGSSFNNEAIKILNQLMDKETLITVVVESTDFTNIRLFDGTKEINKLIYEAMLPSWSSRNKTDSIVFMSNDIMHEKWLNGQNMRLTILSVKAFNEIVVMNEQSKVFTFVLSITPKIDEFCSSNTTPYNPRVQEICLAKFQDESGSNWYRALCSASYENSATVYFIDFGNYSEVSHTDIRKIPPEFVDFPVASKTCKIYGLSDSLPDHIKEDIANEYTFNHLDCMVVCNNNDGSAVLYVPKLMAILTQNHIASVSPPPTPLLMPAPSY